MMKLIELNSLQEIIHNFMDKRLIVHRYGNRQKFYWYYLNSLFTIVKDAVKLDSSWYVKEVNDE